MALTALADYASVLAQRNASGEPYVLVGGQAVNFWADAYQKEERRLEEFRPFLSKDLDLLATTADGQRIAAEIGWEFVPPEPEAENVQGKLRQGLLLVELLKEQGRGLLPPERRVLPQPAPALPVSLRLISPELLLVSKVALAVTVPQDGSVPDIAVRQDLRHAMMLALVVPYYLAEVLAQLPDEAARTSTMQPILAILASVRRGRMGRSFEERHPGVLRWGTLLPPSVRELPFDPVYRHCLEQLDAPVV